MNSDRQSSTWKQPDASGQESVACEQRSDSADTDQWRAASFNLAEPMAEDGSRALTGSVSNSESGTADSLITTAALKPAFTSISVDPDGDGSVNCVLTPGLVESAVSELTASVKDESRKALQPAGALLNKSLGEYLNEEQPAELPEDELNAIEGEHYQQASLDEQGNLQEQAAEQPAETLQRALDDMFRRGLEQGRQEAERELSEALRQQAHDLGYEDGRQSGYQDGYQNGQESAQEAAQKTLDEQLGVIESIHQCLDAHRKILDSRQIVDAARLLERLLLEVVRGELTHSSRQIQDVVEEAVRLLERTDLESLSLRVNPEDASWLQSFIDNSSIPFTLRQDASIAKRGCRVEGQLGEVDATLEERLTDCIEQLRGSLLESPEQAPPIDLSPAFPVTENTFGAKPADSAPNKLTSQTFSVEPTLNKSPAVQPTIHSKPDHSTPVSDKTGLSGLGAWGDLGQ